MLNNTEMNKISDKVKMPKKGAFDSKGIYKDPLIKEFMAFCKINNVEQKAAKILESKINELKKTK